MGDDAAEKFLCQVLAIATVCRKHLANKICRKPADPQKMEGIQQLYKLLNVYQTIQVIR